MKKWILISIVSIIGIYGNSQECPNLVAPFDGATNVPVESFISWTPVAGVNGFIISIGTTPGGIDIVNAVSIGITTTFYPELGLPDDTQIYVTLTLFFFSLPDIECSSQSFHTEDITFAPTCTSLFSPLDSTVDVNIASNISWNYVIGATGYLVTIGTAPGLGDIENNLDVGNTLSFNPISDLPENTEIFVQVVPYNENGIPASCIEESFITGILSEIPDCTSLISPENNSSNVPLSPLIEWVASPVASGYRVYIGKTPFENDILDGGVFFTNSTLVINFEPNTLYFIRIVPFNDGGDAIGCGQESFSTILGCGPFYSETGELITLNPETNFPDQVGICLNDIPTTIFSPDMADGFRWYSIDDNDIEILISSEASVQLFETGTYLYEVYTIIDYDGIALECSTYKEFVVVSSERPTIEGVNLSYNFGGIQIIVQVSGSGDYEYALDNVDGPYQDSNIFINAPEDTSVIYVRDKNGCGIDTYEIINYAIAEGFPKFFTPNGDGFNDYWKYKPKGNEKFFLSNIYIFDRFGKLIKSLDPSSNGWDGTFNGVKLTTAGYWFKAFTTDGDIFIGYFTLKR